MSWGLEISMCGGRQTLHLQLKSAGLGLLRYVSGGASEGQLRRVHTAPCADLSKKVQVRARAGLAVRLPPASQRKT